MSEKESFDCEGGVPNESDNSHFGLTKDELRNRLKHIAGLCYALSCDISNVEIEAEFLRKENEYLCGRLKEAGLKKYQQSPESIEKRRQTMLKYWARKKRERGEDT